MKLFKTYALLISAILFVTSCGKSIEQLSKDWEASKAKSAQLQSEYPNLKTCLEGDVKKGSLEFDKVASAKDEDAQKDLLAKANKAINNGIAGKINALVAIDKSMATELSSLKGKAPQLQVEEANADITAALKANYTDCSDAATKIGAATEKAKMSQKDLAELLKTVSKLEAAKKEVPEIDSKLDNLLSDDEYSTRILKMVMDAKEALKESKTAFEEPYTTFSQANSALTVYTATIDEKLAPLKKIIAEKEEANKPKEDQTTNSSNNSTSSSSSTSTKAEMKVCKYCKTSNDASATKCVKCKAPIKA